MPSPTQLLSTSQAAELLHVSPAYLRQLTAEGKVHASHATPGGHRRYSNADIEQARRMWGSWGAGAIDDASTPDTPVARIPTVPVTRKGVPDVADLSYHTLGRTALAGLIASLTDDQRRELMERCAHARPAAQQALANTEQRLVSFALTFDEDAWCDLVLCQVNELHERPVSQPANEEHGHRRLQHQRSMRRLAVGVGYDGEMSVLNRLQRGEQVSDDDFVGNFTWTAYARAANELSLFRLSERTLIEELRPLSALTSAWINAVMHEQHLRHVLELAHDMVRSDVDAHLHDRLGWIGRSHSVHMTI